MERPTVAIISDDAAFANALTRRWLAERGTPAFVLMQSDSDFQNAADFDVAVLIRIAPENAPAILTALKLTAKPLIIVGSLNCQTHHPMNQTMLPEVVEWPELVVVVAQLILQRERASNDLDRVQELNAELEREASLGRYMLEARHNLNNALTSVLGNSDLILLDPEQLPASLRSQVETIRNMGMRMNEIMQRFSSLQKEMQLIQQHGADKIARATAAGS